MISHCPEHQNDFKIIAQSSLNAFDNAFSLYWRKQITNLVHFSKMMPVGLKMSSNRHNDANADAFLIYRTVPQQISVWAKGNEATIGSALGVGVSWTRLGFVISEWHWRQHVQVIALWYQSLPLIVRFKWDIYEETPIKECNSTCQVKFICVVLNHKRPSRTSQFQSRQRLVTSPAKLKNTFRIKE